MYNGKNGDQRADVCKGLTEYHQAGKREEEGIPGIQRV